MTPPAANFTAIKKPNGEIYIFIWDDGRHLETIQRACDLADNPDLSFTWRDAKRLAKRARELAKEEHRA